MEAEYKTLLQQQKAKKALARVINDPGVRRNLGWAPPKPPQAKPDIDSEGRQVMPTPILNLAVAKPLPLQPRLAPPPPANHAGARRGGEPDLRVEFSIIVVFSLDRFRVLVAVFFFIGDGDGIVYNK